MMLFTALMIAAVSAPAGEADLTPAPVADVVAAAKNCFDAVATKNIDVSRLTSAGWVEALDAAGKPETPGGHLFRRTGVSVEIAVVGSVCSLVAPVQSSADVQTTLLKLDDAIHPDRAQEVDGGILLTKGNRSVLFWVGNPTVATSPAVRIDAKNLENK
jgi:hypothetical protein